MASLRCAGVASTSARCAPPGRSRLPATNPLPAAAAGRRGGRSSPCGASRAAPAVVRPCAGSSGSRAVSARRAAAFASKAAGAASEPPAFPPPPSELGDLPASDGPTPAEHAEEEASDDAALLESHGQAGDASALARKHASKRLMARLRGARRLVHVASAAADAQGAGGLDDIGASFALSCLSKMPISTESDQRAVAEGQALLQAHMAANLGDFRARSLATALHALAKLDGLPASLADAAAVQVCRQAADFKPQEVSMLMWAYAKSGSAACSGPLFDALGRQVVNRAELFKPQELASTLWACATAGVRPRTLLMTVEQECVDKLPYFKPMELANVLWSFASLGQRANDLFDAAAARLLAAPPRALASLNSRDVSMLASAFSQTNRGSKQMYKLLEAQAERCLATFTPPEAAMYLSALARAGTLRPGHLTAFQPVIADMDDELGGKQTATLLWALATAGSAAAGPAADALAGQLSARAKVLAGTLAPRDVSMAAWAVAKLGLPDAPALLGALAERAAACAGCFSPLDLSLLLWAAAAGGVAPGCTLFPDLAADAALLGDQLAPRNLAMVAWAYGTTAARLRSGDATHGVLTALRPHAVAAAPALTPQGLALVAVGYARGGLYFADLFAALELAALEFPAMHSASGITSLALAFAMAGDPGVGLFAALHDEASRRLGEFTPKEVVNLLWASSRASRPAPPALWAVAEARLLGDADALTPIDISRLVDAAAAGGSGSRELLMGVAERAEATLDDFRPHDLTATLKCYLTAGVSAASLYGAVGRHTQLRDSLEPRCLARLALAAAEADTPQPELLLALGPRALAAADGFSTRAAAVMLYAHGMLLGPAAPRELMNAFAAVVEAAAAEDRLTVEDAARCLAAFRESGCKQLAWILEYDVPRDGSEDDAAGEDDAELAGQLWSKRTVAAGRDGGE